MTEFGQKLEDKYHFYVIADLKTWANNENPRSKLEKFDTLDDALNRFKELRSAAYNSETALNQDNQPYARLTLGVSRQDRTGDLDILHVRAGQNYLVTDFMRSPGFSDDLLFMRAMRHVADEVGFERVTDYDKLPDGRWSKGIDMSFPDWLTKKNLTRLEPISSPENDVESTKNDRPQTLEDVVGKFFEGKLIQVHSDDQAWKIEVADGDKIAEVSHNGTPVCDICEKNSSYLVEPYPDAGEFPALVVKAMQAQVATMPTVLSEAEIKQDIAIGDQFRKKLTGEICEVVKLSSELLWNTEDCVVSRKSGAFTNEEDISRFALLDTNQYEFIGNAAALEQPEKVDIYSTNEPEQPTPEMLDNILRGGASDPHSLERIVAYFQKSKFVEENASFLREEFGQDGRGYIHDDGTQFAAWFDENGVTAALGTTAFPDNGQVHLSWEEAAERISDMLQKGVYCEQEYIDRAEANELQDIDESLLFHDRDISGDSFLPDELTEGNFPEAAKKLGDALKNPEILQSTIDNMQKFVAKYKGNPDIVPWYHHPDKILQQLQDLQIQRTDFITQADFSGSV